MTRGFVVPVMSRITKLCVVIIMALAMNNNHIIMTQRFVDPYHLPPQSTMGSGYLVKEESRFMKVIPNARLHGHTILIRFNVSTVQECLYEASYIVTDVQPGKQKMKSSVGMYRSVNYNNDTRTCEINNNFNNNKNIMVDGEVMVTESGWTYYERDSNQEVQVFSL